MDSEPSLRWRGYRMQYSMDQEVFCLLRRSGPIFFYFRSSCQKDRYNSPNIVYIYILTMASLNGSEWQKCNIYISAIIYCRSSKTNWDAVSAMSNYGPVKEKIFKVHSQKFWYDVQTIFQATQLPLYPEKEEGHSEEKAGLWGCIRW